MKKIINWFRDLFYSITDYALIICVVLIVVSVLVWRLNVLFSLKPDKQTIADSIPPITVGENSADNTTNPNDSSNKDTQEGQNPNGTQENPSNSQNPDNSQNSDSQTNSESENKPVITPGQKVEVNIPSGSFPGRIADILIEKGLISDKSKFLTRSTELSLDTKLKAGDFTIEAGTDIDTILAILSK